MSSRQPPADPSAPNEVPRRVLASTKAVARSKTKVLVQQLQFRQPERFQSPQTPATKGTEKKRHQSAHSSQRKQSANVTPIGPPNGANDAHGVSSVAKAGVSQPKSIPSSAKPFCSCKCQRECNPSKRLARRSEPYSHPRRCRPTKRTDSRKQHLSYPSEHERQATELMH